MDDMLGFLVLILAVVSAISKNNKKKQKAQARKAAKMQPTLEESLAEWFGDAASGQGAASKPEPIPETAPAAVKPETHEGLHPCDEHSSEPAKVAQPRLQPRVQITEKPAVVRGSMGEDTHEGLHPCDEHEAKPARKPQQLIAVEEEKPGIQLEWSGENMVKAFIMQEVLTRPCDRRKRA